MTNAWSVIELENHLSLIREREARGVSRAELAEACGLPLTTIENIEHGKAKLRGERARNIWRALSNIEITRASFAHRILDALAGNSGCPVCGRVVR